MTDKQAQQQEPVGKWMGDCIEWTENPYKFRKGQPIYTSPQPAQQFDHTAAANYALRVAQNRSYQIAKSAQPSKPWVGLEPHEANDIMEKESWGPEAISLNGQLLRTIERTAAKLREKNAQPSNTSTPAKCWKCGDADPAFTDVCQVPACGMREQS